MSRTYNKEYAKELIKAQRAFVEDLIAQRKASQLSQQEVADRMGVSQSAVSLFEHYDSNPTLSLIRRYALAVEADLVLQVKPRRSYTAETVLPTYKDQPTTVQAARNGDTVTIINKENPEIHSEELTGKEAKEVLLTRKKDQYNNIEKDKFIINSINEDDEDKSNIKEEPRTNINQELSEDVKEFNTLLRNGEEIPEYEE